MVGKVKRVLTTRAAVVLAIAVAVPATIAALVLYWLYSPAETTEDKKNFVQALVLSVGAVVGIGTLAVGWQNLRQSQRNTQETLLNAREVEERRAQETALQAYFERMGELLTKEGLRVCPDQRPSQEYWDKKHDDVRLSARAQTLTVLLGLDGKRKRALVTFLLETSLIQRYDTVVGLHDADLSDADLQGASLWCVNLSRVNMESADLRAADLRGVDLRNADLNKTKLKIERREVGSVYLGLGLCQRGCQSAPRNLLSDIH